MVGSIECIDELVRKGIRASPLTKLMKSGNKMRSAVLA